MGVRAKIVATCQAWSKLKRNYWNGASGYGCSDAVRGVLYDTGIITLEERDDSNSLWAAQGKTKVLDDQKRFEKLPANTALIPGDIIMYLWHHVAINIAGGVKIFEAAPHKNASGAITHPLSDDGGEVGIYSGHAYNCAGAPITAIYRAIEKEDKTVFTQEHIEKAMAKAYEIANDNTHGYDNRPSYNLGNPNFDCGVFVSRSYQAAGVIPANTVFEPNLPNNDWGYDKILTAAGFVKMPFDYNKVKRGDVLIRDGKHTELACGNNRQIGAHNDYDNGKSGDTYGNEISEVVLTTYWDYMYRLPVDDEVIHPTLQYGSTGEAVKELQGLLNTYISAGLDIDGSFGPLTQAAVKKYQDKKAITADGIVGPVTWAELDAEQKITPEPEVVELTAEQKLDEAKQILKGVYGNDPGRKEKLTAKHGAKQAQQIQDIVTLACKK